MPWQMCQLKSSNALTSTYRRYNIVPFPDMIRMELCKICYKASNDLLPSPLQITLNKRGGRKMHRYDTRFKSTLNVQQHITTLTNTSFICQNIVEYNWILMSIRQQPKLHIFSRSLKRYFIENITY